MQSDTSNNMFGPIANNNSSVGTRLSNMKNEQNARSFGNIQQARTFYDPQSYQLSAVKAAAVQACQAATMNEMFKSNYQQLSLKTYLPGARPIPSKKSASTSATKRIKMKKRKMIPVAQSLGSGIQFDINDIPNQIKEQVEYHKNQN